VVLRRTATLMTIALAVLLPLVVVAAPVAPASAATVTHTVKRGESLTAIAERYGVTLSALLTANKLKRDAVIHPGQKLSVPGGVAVDTIRTPPKLPSDVRSVPARVRLVPTFVAEAARYKVPSDLLMALAYTESAWRSGVVSSAGAIGIGQLLPSTAKWVARDLIGLPRLDPYDPEDNIRMSARYLRWLLDRWPTEKLALAAYFEGGANVSEKGPSRGAQRYARIVQERRGLFRF
jgi:N-acetylmuramoyl-L-alanine amidase